MLYNNERTHRSAIMSFEVITLPSDPVRYFHAAGLDLLRSYDDILPTTVQHSKGVHSGDNNTPNVH